MTVVVDDLDVVAVGVQHVSRVVLRPLAGVSVSPVSGDGEVVVKAPHAIFVAGEGHVEVLVGAPGTSENDPPASPASLGFPDLVSAIVVDGLHVDLLEAPIGEIGEQMSEGPFPIAGGRLADLPPSRADLGPGELLELVLADTLGGSSPAIAPSRRDPDRAPDVSADVLKLLFGSPSSPTFRWRTERQIVAFAIGRETEGENLSFLARPFQNIPSALSFTSATSPGASAVGKIPRP
jgi:hypothetical protein